MKKMNKVYEAPKAEVIEMTVNRAFMQITIGGSLDEEPGTL